MNSRFDCIDACKTCHHVCSQEVSKLIDRTDAGVLGKREIEALIRCAAMCQTTSKVLRDHTYMADAICITCARNCELCADLLAPFDEMQACVQAALQCAECCRATAQA